MYNTNYKWKCSTLSLDYVGDPKYEYVILYITDAVNENSPMRVLSEIVYNLYMTHSGVVVNDRPIVKKDWIDQCVKRFKRTLMNV